MTTNWYYFLVGSSIDYGCIDALPAELHNYTNKTSEDDCFKASREKG